MTLSFYFRHSRREMRGGAARLTFFAACLAIGVAAVVAVAGLARSIDDGIRSRARLLLGADLTVESRRPLPPELDQRVTAVEGAALVHLRELVSMVVALEGERLGPSRLAEIRVADGPYPLYGELELVPDRPLADLLAPDPVSGRHGAVVARELARLLGLTPGSALRIGSASFTVTGFVDRQPDRLEVGFTSIAPRLFLAPSGLEAAGLEQFGSRITYRALVRAPATAAADVRRLAAELGRDLPDAAYLRIETWDQAQPRLRRFFARVARFLGLIALLSLLVGGIGVAQTVRAWIESRLDSIAVLKSLGLGPREVFLLYLGQTALLGLCGSAAGVAAGSVVLALTPALLAGVVPAELVEPFQPAAIARGVGLGMAVAILFSLHPLLRIYRVSPARAFRRDAEPLPPRRGSAAATMLVVAAGTWGMAWIQTGAALLALQVVGALVLAVFLLAAAAALVARAIGRWPRRRAPVWVRHGLTAIGRPGATTVGAIVALGLGVLAVLTMSIVETGLATTLDAELPLQAPSTFLVDIQPHQWLGVEAILREAGARGIDSVPMVSARLAAVDGIAVSDLVAGMGPDDGRRRWVLTREQRLTYRPELPAGNRVIEGALWSDPDHSEVSIEADFARDLGAAIGSRLTLDVQGVPIELLVSSLRTVDWATFGINFFMVVEPGALERAPHSRVAAARLAPDGDARLQQRLVGDFPNVTVIPIRDILESVVGVLRQVGRGVRVLGGFTVFSGVVILGGAVSAGAVRRGREVALLKTIGVTRPAVVAMYAVEYGLVGLVAGLLGTAGGAALALLVLHRWLEIDAAPALAPIIVAPLGAMLLAIAAGLLASAGALARRPIEVLRGEG